MRYILSPKSCLCWIVKMLYHTRVYCTVLCILIFKSYIIHYSIIQSYTFQKLGGDGWALVVTKYWRGPVVYMCRTTVQYHTVDTYRVRLNYGIKIMKYGWWYSYCQTNSKNQTRCKNRTVITTPALIISYSPLASMTWWGLDSVKLTHT